MGWKRVPGEIGGIQARSKRERTEQENLELGAGGAHIEWTKVVFPSPFPSYCQRFLPIEARGYSV